MTHTSTEQPEALRLAETWQAKAQREASRQNSAYDVFGMGNTPESVDPLGASMAAELRSLHARVQELEASQAQRVPLSADEIKEPKNGEVWRVEWWNESLRMMLPSDKVLHRFNAYQNGTLQFTLKAHAHGITQEKQG